MSVYGWGRNSNAELGEACNTQYCNYFDPKLIGNFEELNVTSISCGQGYGLALDEFGNVFSFGQASQGQLGHGASSQKLSKPEMVGGPLLERRVASICASFSSSAAVTEEGELYEWGLVYFESDESGPSLEVHGLSWKERRVRRDRVINPRLHKMLAESEQTYLQNQNLDTESSANTGVVNLNTRRRIVSEPVRARLGREVIVKEVSLGAAHIIALTTTGSLLSKGYNDRGQLGVNSRVSRATFEPVFGPINEVKIRSVACGNAHCLAVDENNEMWSWGGNPFGQLGLGPSEGEQLFPVKVDFEKEVLSVSCGDYHSVCLTVEQEVYSWGHNEYGQHGMHTAGHDLNFAHLTRYYHSPRLVSPFSQAEGVAVASIHATGGYTMVIDVENNLWSFGWNGFGLLGRGSGSRHNSPGIVDLVGVAHIAPGPNQVLVVLERTTSQFARSFQPLLREGMDFDVTIVSRETEIRKATRARCHKFMIFARCPELEEFLENDEIRLPFVLAPLVLQCFVEYLYCDHIQSCPVHRIPDLNELADKFKLLHLASLCAFARARRQSMLSGNKTVLPEILPSNFHHDMGVAFGKTEYHNVFLEANEEDDGDGKENFPVSAHLDVLLRYPFFEKLLTGNFKESIGDDIETRKQTPVVLHNLTPKSLRSLLFWVYTGDREKSVDPETVMSALAAAKCFGVDDLAKVCEHFLLENCTAENVHFIKPFAEDVNSPRLLYRCERILQTE